MENRKNNWTGECFKRSIDARQVASQKASLPLIDAGNKAPQIDSSHNSASCAKPLQLHLPP